MSDDNPGNDDPASAESLSVSSDVDGVAAAEHPASSALITEAAPRRRRLLALTALGLGIGAAVVCIGQLVSASPAGWLLTLGLAVAGVVCGVVALERREHRTSAFWAVSVAGLAGIFAVAGMLPQADLEGHVYGYAAGPTPATAEPDAGAAADPGSTTDEAGCPVLPEPPADMDADFYYGAMYAADLDEKATADPAVIAFELPVRLASTATGAEIMSMTADAPIDVTQAAADGSVSPPLNGVYLAVKVSYTDFVDATFACFKPAWPSSWWVADAGDEFDLATVSIPSYPTLEDGGLTTEDSAAYYDIFDVSLEAAASGTFRVVMLAPDLTQQVFYWGEVSP